MNKIKKCGCSNYTLNDKCPHCGLQTHSAHPMKFSPDDKYGKYRRIARERSIQ